VKNIPFIGAGTKKGRLEKVGLFAFRRKREEEALTSVNRYFDRNSMQRPAVLLSRAKAPVATIIIVTKQCIEVTDYTGDVYNRMAGENLGKSLGKVTGQTAIWPFMQEQVHDQHISGVFPVYQFDIIRPFIGIAEEGFKKIIGPFFRENFL
jgi:hypothetical protein